jgi:hypothetical protein
LRTAKHVPWYVTTSPVNGCRMMSIHGLGQPGVPDADRRPGVAQDVLVQRFAGPG